MCPVCDRPMVSYQHGGVEIDHCVNCRGTWLDAGELETLTELAGADAGELSRRLRASEAQRRTRRRCPRCPRRLREMRFGTEQVEIDHCMAGHGLWFDENEMEAVIRSFAAGQQQRAVAAFFADLFGGGTGAEGEA